jgi:hypothetical protein
MAILGMDSLHGTFSTLLLSVTYVKPALVAIWTTWFNSNSLYFAHRVNLQFVWFG